MGREEGGKIKNKPNVIIKQGINQKTQQSKKGKRRVKEEEEEEGERRIKPKHSLLHAVAGKKTNKRQQRRRGGGCMHTHTNTYIYTVYVHTLISTRTH